MMDWAVISGLAASGIVAVFLIGCGIGISYDRRQRRQEERREQKRAARYEARNRLAVVENSVLNLRNDLSILQRQGEYKNTVGGGM